jgi:hypothetical protein
MLEFIGLTAIGKLAIGFLVLAAGKLIEKYLPL